MKAETREIASMLLGGTAGAISAFVFFALTFNGALVGSYVAWASITLVAYFVVLAATKIQNGLRPWTLVPSLLLAIFGFFGAIGEFSRVFEFLFWPGYLVLQLGLVLIAEKTFSLSYRNEK